MPKEPDKNEEVKDKKDESVPEIVDKLALRNQIRENLGVPPLPDRRLSEDDDDDDSGSEEEETDDEDLENENEEEQETEEESEDEENDDDSEEEEESEDDDNSEDDDEDSEEEEESEDDLDLDEDPDSEQEEEEESEDDEPSDEQKTNAVKELKKVGKEKKKLERKLQLAEEQLVAEQTRLKEAQDELEKFTLVKIDPASHPEFVSKQKEIGNSILGDVLSELGESAAMKMKKTWGDLLTDADTFKNLPFDDKPEALKALNLKIAKNLGLVDEDATELNPEFDEDAIAAAKYVSKTLQSHTGGYKELATIYASIQNRAGEKSLEIGHREYLENSAPIRQSLALIDTMSEKDIADDPNSLQSIAAKKINSSPELKTKAAKIDKYLIEMVFGPEALSQEELDRHVKSGKDMDEFHKLREKRVTEFRERRLPEIKSLMVLLPEIKKMLPDLFSKNDQEAAEKTRKQKLRKATKKKAPKKKTQDDAPPTKEQLKEKMRRTLGA